MNLTELGIILPALLAGMLVLSTHVPLGRMVLSRGIIFIDLAIAQIAGLGVIIAFIAGLHDGWQVQAAAASAALIGALALYLAERIWPDVQEAVIGVAFVIASSIGLLLIADNPHGGEHLKEVLAGQILWVDYVDLVPVAFLYAAVLLLGRFLISKSHPLPFYLLFAITITASVQLVGVYLVFASLILPSLAVYRLPPSRQVPVGYAVGLLGYLSGLLIASLLDMPAGPTIVVSLACISLVMLALLRK